MSRGDGDQFMFIAYKAGNITIITTYCGVLWLYRIAYTLYHIIAEMQRNIAQECVLCRTRGVLTGEKDSWKKLLLRRYIQKIRIP